MLTRGGLPLGKGGEGVAEWQGRILAEGGQAEAFGLGKLRRLFGVCVQ